MADASLEFDDNPEDRCLVVLVLDTSESMAAGGKIEALNAGIAQFRTEILADPIASLRVEVSIITFGGTVQVVHEFSTIDNLHLRPLRAGGDRPLGEAVDTALDEIEHRKAEHRGAGINYYRPWLWLITDGEPTDGWRSAAARARQAEADKKATVFCVGVGSDANFAVLNEFSAARPPLSLDGMKFQEMFKWLSASRSKASQADGDPGDQAGLPAGRMKR